MALAMDAMEDGGPTNDDLTSVANRLSALLGQLVTVLSESELSLVPIGPLLHAGVVFLTALFLMVVARIFRLRRDM